MEFLISLLALAISIIALIATLLQAKESKANDGLRRCSTRTMGGWAKRTQQHWIWGEARCEIKVSTPKIKINPGPATFMEEGFEQQSFKQYEFHQAARVKLSKSVQQLNASDKPWFLSAEIALPQHKCSWLALLENTAKTNVKVIIEEEVSTFDFALDPSARPCACTDRTSFLTLMCLFGIRWENKGQGTDLVGKGDVCEISVVKLSHRGSAYIYHDLFQENVCTAIDLNSTSTAISAPHRRYYLTSERARMAMFNHFDFGFARFKTSSAEEVEESIKQTFPDVDVEVVNTVGAYYRGSNGWCPGLSEAITCWAEQSMPKMVDEATGKFKSMFSAVPARSLTTGTPQFVAMLLGDGSTKYHDRREIPSVGNITDWAKEYFLSFPELERKVYGGLKWAATWSSNYQNNIVDPDIPWVISLDSLKGIRELDDHLEEHLLADYKSKDRKKIKSAMTYEQIVSGCNLFGATSQESENNSTSSWLDELDRVGSENYEHIVTKLADLLQEIGGECDPMHVLARRIVVNRLMRGSLWVIHNGNAPDQYKRVLECSLSSAVLEQNPYVYIV